MVSNSFSVIKTGGYCSFLIVVLREYSYCFFPLVCEVLVCSPIATARHYPDHDCYSVERGRSCVVGSYEMVAISLSSIVPFHQNGSLFVFLPITLIFVLAVLTSILSSLQSDSREDRCLLRPSPLVDKSTMSSENIKE